MKSRVALAAAAVGVGAVLGLGWVLYAMPDGHWSTWGANVPGARHFGGALGIAGPLGLGEEAFRRGMRWAIAIAWLGYGAALVAGHAVAVERRTVVVAAAIAAGAVAVLFPPALSCDAYAYVAYARLPVIHRLNPYLHGPLVPGDPTAPFLQWKFPSPYGPLWTALSIALVAPLAGAALLWQVLAFKIAAAAALVGLTVCAGALGERLAPARGGLAALAIGLNPLFLVEGPGAGHNDLVLVLALLAGAWALARGRPYLGASLVGASVAIKLVTVVVIPWLVIERVRAKDARGAFAVAALALAPVLVLGALFWPAGIAGLLAHAGAHGETAVRWGLAAVVFVFATAHVIRGGDWHAAWIATALAIVLLGLGVWYPWYFTWPLALALPRWQSRAALAATIASLALALMAMALYTRG